MHSIRPDDITLVQISVEVRTRTPPLLSSNWLMSVTVLFTCTLDLSGKASYRISSSFRLSRNATGYPKLSWT